MNVAREINVSELVSRNRNGMNFRRSVARHNHSILLIDHDRKSIDASSRFFEEIGYKATASFHPFHGLALTAEQQFSVAVVDIQMLDTDGLEMLQKFVDLELFPVIVHTAEQDEAVRQKAIEIGAVHCFTKPANMFELTKMVERVCR